MYGAFGTLVSGPFPIHGPAHATPAFPRTGPGGPGSPPSSVLCRRYDSLHRFPFGLLIRQPVPRLACLFAPDPPQAGAGPDPLFPPVVRVPASVRGQCRASQVPWRAIPWLCERSLTPVDPPAPRPWRRCRCCPRELQDEGVGKNDCGAQSRRFTTRCVRFTTCVATRHATRAPSWRAAPLPGGCRTRRLAVKGFS